MSLRVSLVQDRGMTGPKDVAPPSSLPLASVAALPSLEIECVEALRRILAEHVGEPMPNGAAEAVARFRTLISEREPDAVLIRALMSSQSLVRTHSEEAFDDASDEFILVAAASVVVEPGMPNEAMLHGESIDFDELVSVSVLTSADWLQFIVNGAKRGAGQYFGADDMFDWIEDDVVPDDLPTVEIATVWIDRLWGVVGITDDEERLTPLGAWILPRAICLAWGANFDTPLE
jgi:hypothetical protein